MASPQNFVGRLSQPRLGLLGRGLCGLLPCFGLALGAGFESWSKVEQAQETSDYGLRIREGKFEAEQKAFIEETLLPQLGLEANRAAITSVRQRIRDIAVRGATKKEVIDQGNAAIRDGMLRIVSDQNADPVVRINAMLLVGELQGWDRAPWPGSLAPLAKAAADASLPLAVRVAALKGLARQVTTAGETGAAATQAAPVVNGLVSVPPEGDPVAVRWLVSRALELLPSLPAQPATVAAAARILADDKADPDLRVRAALAIGKLASPEAGLDAAAAIGQIRSLAIAALATDLDAAEARRLDRKLSGAAGREDSPPAAREEDAVPTLACRRNAWRLHGLAEAVRPARSGTGLAGLLQGEPATAAAELATSMRQSAIELDANPDEESLAAALAALKNLAAAGAGPAAGQGQAGGEAAPTRPASPFDQPAGSSPF